jgi:hypothetical protein
MLRRSWAHPSNVQKEHSNLPFHLPALLLRRLLQSNLARSVPGLALLVVGVSPGVLVEPSPSCMPILISPTRLKSPQSAPFNSIFSSFSIKPTASG